MINTGEGLNLGLIGWPLAHSLSPQIHQAAMDSVGLTGTYRLIPVAAGDRQGLKKACQRLRQGEMGGLNVTIPYKQTVIPFLDGLTPPAKAVGAVNTLFMKDGQLLGDNTDVAGFMMALAQLWESPHLAGQALVLGAGGAARAVCFGLLRRGWQVTVAARRLLQAKQLAADLIPSGAAQARMLSPAMLAGQTPALVVNATPVGMWPETALSPWPEGLSWPVGAACFDLIYNPPETRLMTLAAAAGCPVQNGTEMLVAQAARSFQRWVGIKPDQGTMLAALKAANNVHHETPEKEQDHD